MENSGRDEEIIKYDKRFGKVTKNQIEIYGGSNPKINISAVNKVKLVKIRVFYTNFVFLTITLACAYLIYEYFDMELVLLTMLSVFTFAMLIFTFVHKFYRYTVVIKLKNGQHYTMRASPVHRQCIKEFYYAIFNILSNDKLATTVSVKE